MGSKMTSIWSVAKLKLSSKLVYGRTDVRTDGRTDVWTYGRTPQYSTHSKSVELSLVGVGQYP